ncbi:MAG: general secretion pathway protein GspB, partial [Gammaproteobacteria bacterium]
ESGPHSPVAGGRRAAPSTEPQPATPGEGGMPGRPVVSVASPPAATLAEVPLLQDLPADDRRGLPTLHVDVHVYDQDPARRFVLINMQRYREGDTLAAGPRLLHITRAGVVLEYHGVRFRLATD